MTRIEKIIAKARITLADKDKQRWTDDDLLHLVDEGQKDFCRETQLLTGQVLVPLIVGQAYFALPENCWMLTRVTYANEPLSLKSHTELDNLSNNAEINNTTVFGDFNYSYGDDWESDTGSPEAIIYDRRNLQQCKIYPIPDESVVDNDYNFNDPVDAPFVNSGLLGVVAEIDEYTFNTDFGVVAELYDPEYSYEFIDSPFGVVTNIFDMSDILRCYYIRIPSEITSVNDTLETPAMFDTALKYYVIGHAFLNDIDTEYQAKGSQQLTLYKKELDIAKSTEMRSGTRAGQFETTYRRGV